MRASGKVAILTYLMRGAGGILKAGRAQIGVANGLDLGDFPLDAEHVEFGKELVDGYGVGRRTLGDWRGYYCWMSREHLDQSGSGLRV